MGDVSRKNMESNTENFICDDKDSQRTQITN